MGQWRSSVLLEERNGAFSDILHTNPHPVGRSHPVSVEVREFDWDSSRKGASQLSRTKTIRLSTPKTTTGEILIFALTSPLNCCRVPYLGCILKKNSGGGPPDPPTLHWTVTGWKFVLEYTLDACLIRTC